MDISGLDEKDELDMPNKLLSAPAKESKTCCPNDAVVPLSSLQVETVAQCTPFRCVPHPLWKQKPALTKTRIVDHLGMSPSPALGVRNDSFVKAEPSTRQPTPGTSSEDSKHEKSFRRFPWPRSHRSGDFEEPCSPVSITRRFLGGFKGTSLKHLDPILHMVGLRDTSGCFEEG